MGETAPLTFDISIWQFLAPLLVGGRAHIFAEDLATDPALMMGEVDRAGVSILETGPTQLAILLDEAERLGPAGPAAARLRWLLVSGEALPPALCARWLDLHPGVPLVNAYGATECSDDVTHQTIRAPLPPQALQVPLGRLNADSRLYILDRLFHPVPIGVAGEIHLGGICVGRGYFRDPARTAASFVPDPFAAEPGLRLYRTGDLGRYRPDGNTEYLGRIDFQVKVRGFRIELGEIEAALAAHPAVAEAVVLARRDGPGEVRLIAYVVPQGEPPGVGELRAFVGQRLPEYMAPSAFLVLESWPLTPNGKLDRKALPAPGPERPELERPYEAPRGAAEAALAGIWAEVLRLDRVGIHDNFFELGGDSILSIQIVSRAKTAGLPLTPKLLFECQTVAELAARVEEAAGAAPAAAGPPPRTSAKQLWREGLDPRLLNLLQAKGWEIEDLYPLAPTQSGMLFFHILEPAAHPFFEQASWRLHGRLDPVALRAAWEALLDRHPVLRTCFVWEGLAEPLQAVLRKVDLSWDAQDWQELAPGEWDARVDAFLRADRRRGLDLSRAPLMRLSLIRLGPETYQFTWSWHHIVMDGWSSTMITREGLALYDALSAGREIHLEERRPYGEYVGWLMEQDLAAAERFWRRELAGYTAPLRLAVDRSPGSLPREDAVYRAEDLFLGAGVSAALRAVARRSQVTLNTVFQGIWALILARYGGTDDVVFGVTSSGRPPDLPGVESIVGLFLLTLPMRMRVVPEVPLPVWLRRIQERQIELRQYEYTSLVQVRGWSEVPPEQPLFETFLVFQNFPEVSADQWHGRGLEVSQGRGYDRASDPLLLVVAPNEEIVLRISYDTDRFDPLGMQRLAGQLSVLLDAVAAGTERRLRDLPLLTAAESHQAVLGWNDTGTGWDLGCVHRVFEEHAARRPEAVALVADGREWTYAALNRRAGRLARFLARRGVGPEDLVALMVDRGPGFLTAALALSKVGGAFLPLDPLQPPARTAQILAGATPVLILVEGDRAPLAAEAVALAAGGPPRWPVVGIESILAREWGSADLPCRCHLQGLAYVIYTSGSTGVPKGAMIEFQGMMNHLWDKVVRFELTSGSAVAQTAPLTFDIAVWEFLAVLLAGGRAHVVADEVAQDPLRLMREVEAAGISVLETGPSLLAVLVEEMARAGGQRPRAAGLRWLLVSGEALPPPLCTRWLELYPHVPMVNAYGATECSDDVTHVAIREPLPESSTGSPLGAPLPDSTLYVLDRELRPLPVGVPGEIYLGGVCVGRGYRNDPQRTAEAFFPDPFSALPGRRFYKTGDLGRYLPDGNAEFLGRIDFQVKVRGFRVELGEVEAVLSRHPRVHQAVVLARGQRGGDSLLVAYVLAEEMPGPAAGELAAFLGARLPDYMVPAAFVALDAFPLTVNGKVDRRKLPDPESHRIEKPSRPPATVVEETLAAIWLEVLQREAGALDDFFDLGGHSLRAIQVASRIRQAFQIEVPLRRIFELPVLADLAHEIEAALRAGGSRQAPPLVRLPADGPQPVSFAQQRLWLIDQLAPGSTAYNMSSASHFAGPLDLGALAASLSELVRRHETLRTTFQAPAGEPMQAVAPAAPLQPPIVDLSALEDEARWREARLLFAAAMGRPFDLAQGPLFRVGLLRLAEREHAVLATMHHIVSDAWSMDILQREVAALYDAFSRRAPSPLPELPFQYADFARWQRQWLRGAVLEEELAYWRGRLAGAPQVLALPVDRPRPAVRTTRGGGREIVLPWELGEQTRTLGRLGGATLFMTTLAIFQALLARRCRQEDFCLGTPIAGRTRVEVEGLIGFFVNTLVLRCDVSGQPGFLALLRRVREVTLEAQTHQELPFEKLVEELDPVRSLSHSPLFQAMFSIHEARGDARETDAAALARWPGSAEAGTGTAKFDLAMAVREVPDGLVAALEYSTDLFDSTTALRLLEQFRNLLSAVVAEPERPVTELPLLSGGEAHQLLREWNDTALPAGEVLCLHELFEIQAARAPEAIAVVDGDRRWTYRELDRRAGHLARHLRALGVGPEVRVGICLERSAEMIAGLLAILKAGGAYVPLDPGYPGERLAFLLEDSGAAMVLTAADSAGKLPAGVARVRLDAIAAAPVAGDGALPRTALPGNLAYLIYTSGSTGRPKGVGLEHRSPVALLRWASGAFSRAELAGMLASTSIAFDLSVFEIFLPLSAGGALILAENALELPSLAAAGEVTLVNTVPSVLAELLRSGELPHAVRTVGLAGEPLPGWLVAELRRGGSVERVCNLYGPSETTTYSTAAEVALAEAREPHIGRPIAGTRTYVLDASLDPVPPGSPGELWLGGAGLARGYLGHPELTAERFVPDPFSAAGGARLYGTGDLARQRPDGVLEFLGRIDHQVKVRGFRIELGEIESALTRLPEVREAAVLVSEDGRGEKSLVAFVVPEAGAAFVARELRRKLAERLPDYMVPASCLPLAALPQTSNGKVDRRALAALAITGPERTRRVAPRGLTEQLLAELWSQVLNVDEVGATDNFFDLGGHSLLATRLVSRVRQGFGVELPLRSLFEAPTLAALAREVEAGLKAGRAGAEPPLRPVPREGEPRLSFAQKRLWFLDQLDPGSPLYNIPLAVRFEGELRIDAVARALSEVVRRHEALRTSFAIRGGEPVQVIAPASAVPLPVVDLSALAEEPRSREAQRLAGLEAQRPFDLSRGPLLRAGLLRLGERDHAVLATIHHVVGDGWSIEVLNREVAALYEAFSRGGPSPLPELPIQYADYAEWQRRWLQGDVLERELHYWRERLRGVPPLLELPADRPRLAERSFRGSGRPFKLSAELSQELRSLSRRGGATLYMTLLAGFEALLFRVSGSEDFCVGTPVAGRTRVELEELIGFFVNTLVLRADLSGRPSFRELVQRVREVAVEAQAHQELPFDRLVEELQPSRSLSHSPLFQVMFELQHLPRQSQPVEGLTGRPVGVEAGTAKFDLALGLADSGGALAGGAEFASDLFDATTISRLLEHFGNLLAAAAAAPERPVTELPLLSAGEAHQLLREWNDTAAAAGERCLHELFELQAARTPEATALVFQEERLSYRELDERAGRLARVLGGRGVGPGALVGLCLERSAEMIVGLIAILKAGAAYVPLDPEYPSERLAFVIEDTGMTLVLTQLRLLGRLPESGIDALCLDPGTEIGVAGSAAANPASRSGADDLAYVIYTSGSTGRPKGVLIRHGAASHVAAFTAERFGIGPGSRGLQFASLNFDASVLEIWTSLLSGATLFLLDQQTRLSMPSLADRLSGQGITWMLSPPSLLEAIPWRHFPELRTILVGGEPCSRETAERWSAGRGFYNAYGPTETTVYSTLMPCAGAVAEAPPIGRPIAGVEIHLLDASFRPVPIGVAGELCIGGPVLAVGYLGRPGLTAGAFVPHPYSSRPGERLYRTGDLARRRPDGVLEFLGRIDQQVKVRGFRVELGEVEAVLGRHPGVREAAVLPRGDRHGYRTLTACLVPEEPGRFPPTAELRRFAAERLPDYMVPASFVMLDSLPLTPNGKVDRRALAAIEPDRSDATDYVAPRRLTEELLAELWSEVLDVERVGVSDDFFELGGHSLLATRLVSRVRESFGVELPVRSVFESPVLAALAAGVDELLRAGGDGVAPPLVARLHEQAPPLSFAQERLWFIDQLSPGSPLYNIPLAVRFEGPLKVPALASSLSEVVRRHQALRTTFEMREGGAVQVIAPFSPPPLPLVDLSGLAEAPRMREARRLAGEGARRPFDLARGPLLRAVLLRLGARDHLALTTMHHIVGDGWSMQVFQREVFLLYEAVRTGRAAPLPELPIQYADYSRWQREWLSGETLERELDHWRRRLQGAAPLLELPWDRPRPAAQTFRGGARSLTLTSGLTQSLRTLGRREGATLFMVLLAGLEALLGRWARQTDFCVGAPVAGRTRLEIENLIGFFVNTLVLRGDLSGEPSGRELLRRAREVCVDAHAHQELPFEKLVEHLAPERSLSHTPLFQVMLVLQNLPRSTEALGELAVSSLGVEGTVAKFDLTLALSEGPGGVAGELEFNSDLFDGTTISRLVRHLERLLAGMAAAPERRLSELPLLSEPEAHQVAREWNDTAAGSQAGRCLHELFEAQVARRGEAVALAGGAGPVSYRELDLRANRIARWLRKRGIGPEVRVGLCLERTPELVAALLGVLKAGGVYVPLDAASPLDRLSYQVADAGLRLLLTQEELRTRMPAGPAEVVCLDLERGAIDRQSGERLDAGVTPENLAYVIYTSGSTGLPKGVLVEHRGVPNVLAAQSGALGVREGDRVLQLASLGFDASVFELVMALGSGATLYLADRDSLLPGEGLARLLREEEISHLTITPSALAVLPEAPLPALRCLVVAGEACPADLVERWAPGRRFFNAYGPTEATIWTTVEVCAAGGPEPPLIGRPIPNVRIYGLDAGLRPVSPGAAAELYIGGAQVVRGYLNRPALTAERFLPDPFGGEPGSRFYRTGDLARFRPDGRIEFLGRVDDQVKIRGVRVEPGEIEAALGRHPDVREAVVAAREDGHGGRSLTAWVVPVPGSAVSGAELRRHLAERLPEPMVPSFVMLVEALPRTPAGKVDRRALPAPDRTALSPGQRVPPRNEAELLLAEIWEEVLGIQPVGVTTSFFELGGHSLLAVRLMARVRERTGCDLPLSALFQYGTIEGLAALLSRRQEPSRRAAVVPMRIAAGGRRPLFLLHPVGGNVLCYAELARRLGSERTVYGVQVPDADGLPPAPRLEEMAARYLAAVRAVQPSGPYALAGWSMGGTLAYEMARQLRKAGEEGALLVVIDALAPGRDGSPGRPLDDGEVLRGFLGDLAGLTLGAAGGPPDLAEARGEGLRQLFERGRGQGLLPADVDFSTVERLFEMFRRNLRALEAYAGKPCPGSMLALLSEASGTLDGGWGALVSGPVEVHRLPGDHYSILREPGLDRLAEILGNSLRQWELE